MDIVAVTLLAGTVVGYFVLAGNDVGLGMLMPFVARGEAERRRVVRAAAPYFLGTEVWLVGAVGVVAGLFPALKSAVITGMWPVFTVLLAGWLIRDAGLWFRGRFASAAGRGVCDAAIVTGSWTLALTWGLVFAGLLGGGALPTPFAITCAATVATLFALRGAAFGAERLVPRDTPAPVPGSAPAAVGGGGHAVAGGTMSGAVGAGGHAAAGGAMSGAVGAPAPAPRPSDAAESADAAARATRPLARVALAGVVLTAGAALLPGGAVADRPLMAVMLAVPLAVALAATSGLSGPGLARHTSAAAMALLPLLVAAAVALPVAAVPPGTSAMFWLGVGPALPFIALGQVALYRMLRRPAPAGGFFG
ncbi:cytochrome d ubiquinol oxidase subunit II [Streptomonospora sp. S1-112]|uniref:Cytochrome d ubiquinol oxidase subunit II n=1 Tax=Streptomonospora mangrovi TaxID=2883123 RepID=A0A9X3NFU6_9ACTN|nr:cytochrome d ubiquinol oxidase subunit II [Streptomonospora mangrovi]MDA0562732.1 cytochrome d ubiquinol oxidase subunit II [Streptomonospora mangrovi]